MSSKAKKRKAEYEKRQAKRKAFEYNQEAIRKAKTLEQLANAMGIRLE